MATCGDLITEASSQLHGWGQTQDRVASLAGPISSGELAQFTVNAASGQAVGISPGFVEIDSEQLYVTSVDQTTGICTLDPGFGRGYNGTSVAAHSAGAKVISRPKFPRASILKQINETLGGVFPDLFKVQTFTGTVTYPLYRYTLSGIPQWVISVEWQDPIGNWIQVKAFNLDPYDQSLLIGSGPMIGRPLRALYTVEPGLFVNETDDYVTTTGLPISTYDVITIGTVARLTPGLDISRAQLTSVEQSDRSRVVPPNAGINVGKYLQQMYLMRLANEAKSLRRIYKPRVRKVL